MEKLLKLNEVCEIFGVTRWTIRNWISEGRFPKPLRRGYLRWPEDEIGRLIERMKRNR
jgi:predicted DNA-binding transcriptional regulator AlpA